MPRHTDNTWLERIAGYLLSMTGKPNGSNAGNPNVQNVGGIYYSDVQTFQNGQQVVNHYDSAGNLLVATTSSSALKDGQQTTITSSVAETTIVTAVASTFMNLYGLILTNTSGTVTKVIIKDATAGSQRFVFEIPALETRGFMVPKDSAHKQAAVNNNWTATCGTSVASVEITALTTRTTS